MITDKQRGCFGAVMDDAVIGGAEALATFPRGAQWDMAIEEIGELLTAMARKGRGRASDADVTNECADVIITTIQVALMHGGGDLDWLIAAIAAKTERLRARLLSQREVAGE